MACAGARAYSGGFTVASRGKVPGRGLGGEAP